MTEETKEVEATEEVEKPAKAKAAKKASKAVVDSVNTWAEKVAMGQYFEDEGGVTAQLVKHIIIGEDGKGLFFIDKEVGKMAKQDSSSIMEAPSADEGA